MKKKILITIYFFLSALFIFRLFYFFNRHRRITLTYHNIIPNFFFDDTIHLGVSHRESVFENHLRFITRRFSETDLKNRILFTFDDGYQNQYQIASKLLEKYNLVGVFFVSLKLIKMGATLTIDQITQWVSYVPNGCYTIFNQSFLINDENRVSIFSRIYDRLLSDHLLWGHIENELNVSYSFENLNIHPDFKKLRFSAISEVELSEMRKRGHLIAAHSWCHYPLSTLPIEQQQRDFELCVVYMPQYCNSDWYSYPFGSHQEVSKETIGLCEQYGFSAAYTNSEISCLYPDRKQNYQLPRISLPNHANYYILDAKLSGFEFFCKAIIAQVKRMFQWKKAIILNG